MLSRLTLRWLVFESRESSQTSPGGRRQSRGSVAQSWYPISYIRRSLGVSIIVLGSGGSKHRSSFVVLPEGAALNAGGVIPCASMCSSSGEAAQEQDADENAEGSAARWKGRMITVEVSNNSFIAALIRRVDPDRQRIELEAPVVVYGMELTPSVRFSVGPWVGHALLLMQHALQKLRSRSDIPDTVLMNWALRGAADSCHL